MPAEDGTPTNLALGPPVGLDHDAVVVLQEKLDAQDTPAQRTEKASDLALDTAHKAAVLADDAQARAVQLAVANALRVQHVDTLLADHSTHLATINGSIGDLATEQKAQGLVLARIDEKVGGKVTKRANKMQLITLTIMLSSVGIAALGATGHL